MYELLGWQVARLVEKIGEVNDAFRRRVLCSVGLDDAERPLFQVPINRVQDSVHK